MTDPYPTGASALKPIINTHLPSSKFKFSQGQEIRLPDGVCHVFRVTESYVTIYAGHSVVHAGLMELMDKMFDAVYTGPTLDSRTGLHLTFKKKD